MTVTTDLRADARLGLLVLDAEDMYVANGTAATQPAAGPRMAASWKVRGYIVGTDAVFRPLGSLAPGSQRVFYGALLESIASPGSFVAVVRGTYGFVEWFEDGEFWPVSGKRPGHVESGFFGIYDTFSFRSLAGVEIPLVSALAEIVGAGKLTVTGHSLGSALATYLAYDLGKALPGHVALRVFASPHSGDATFIAAAAAAVPDHIHYALRGDVVPDVPAGLGYTHLPNTVILEPSTEWVEVRTTRDCLHHVLCYTAVLDPETVKQVPAQDQCYMQCITVCGTQAA